MKHAVYAREPALSEEFYSFASGDVARVEMHGDALSQVVVTDAISESTNNRYYMRILDGDADQISRQQYDLRRAALKRQALALVHQ